MINIEFDPNKIHVDNAVHDKPIYNINIIANFTNLVNYIKKINKLEQDRKKKLINNFRIRNLSNSIDIISNLNYDLTLDNIKQFNAPGIGKGTIDRIIEILKNKRLKELDELHKISKNKKIDIITELNDVINIGDKHAIELIKKFKVKSVADLKHKVDKGLIEVNDKIKMGLKYYGKYKTHIPRHEIDLIYKHIDSLLHKLDPSYFFFICGSYRRGNDHSNDIDILLLHPELLQQKYVNETTFLIDVVNMLKDKNFIIDDLTDADGSTKYMGFCKYKNYDIRRIDIRMIAIESYVPAIAYFTGSYELNRQMRKRAKELGYKLNEYGLYDEQTNKSKVLYTEEQLFDELEMNYLDPEERNIF